MQIIKQKNKGDVILNDLQIFKNEEFGKIRTILIDGEPWFVGKDVAGALGYVNTTKAVINHVYNEDKKFMMVELAQSQNGTMPKGSTKTAFINESGLYSLILSSKLDSAKKFKHWITSEVLPSIRQYGSYIANPTQLINDPEFFIAIGEKLKENQKQIKELKQSNEEMQPKAKYFDDLVDKKLLTNFRDTAKELHMSQKEFIQSLLNDGYIYRDKKNRLRPYKNKNNGLFELKEFKNGYHVGVQTFITPKGRATFNLLYNNKKVG